MTTSQRELRSADPAQPRPVAAGGRLPAAVLTAVGGEAVDLHRLRGDSTVVVFPHPACGECAGYLDALDALRGDLGAWDADPTAVVTDADEARALAGRLGYRVLVDPGARARRGAGLAADGAAVVVADRFGTVYRSDAVGDDHRFPIDDQLRTEVRYIAIQCPECSVPDLAGADLAGADVAGADLARADLARADVAGGDA